MQHTFFQFEDDEDESSSTTAQQPKRHKPSMPLQPIQENVSREEEHQIEMDTSESPSHIQLSSAHGRTLGFDESMYDKAEFIDPKSLFLCMFRESLTIMF
jgi:hypothetical protein